ncbi:uncharacterized protein LOC129724553 [Wyeomyia smithii]|uniref:uncharacterized protein LOC129724553 n=1 Tax=Wyeomyia smithii TaxID=174621 RepID=UPI0024680B26|nr:uncharacterized protein LOC129724553 [Wyeomyia smithii]
MKYLGALLGVVVLAVAASAEFGYYIPKAFYKIDENGYRSPLTYIDNLPPIFHRTRRAAQLGGVNFGFPIQFPQFPQIPTGQGNFQGVQTSITSTGGGSNLNNRFDEDGPAVQTTFTSFSHNNGQYSQTTHFVDKDGKVTTHKQSSGPKQDQPQQQQQAQPQPQPQKQSSTTQQTKN